VSGKIAGAGHQRKGEVSQTSADRAPGGEVAGDLGVGNNNLEN
jgi:hypothetical protein